MKGTDFDHQVDPILILGLKEKMVSYLPEWMGFLPEWMGFLPEWMGVSSHYICSWCITCCSSPTVLLADGVP